MQVDSGMMLLRALGNLEAVPENEGNVFLCCGQVRILEKSSKDRLFGWMLLASVMAKQLLCFLVLLFLSFFFCERDKKSNAPPICLFYF